MRSRRRHSLALLVSLAGHVVTVGGFSGGFHCIPQFEVPELEFEFAEVELVDPELLQGEQAEQAEPEPPPPAPEPPPPEPVPEEPEAEEQQPEPEPEPPPPPEPEPEKFAAKGSRADKLAPPTSTFYMLLVPKKIRGLPFSQQVLDIMAPLPDFELLIDKGRFDALHDFDHIVIASPDIRDWTQTFLAVDYTVPREEVKLAIERAVAANGEVIEWVDDGGLLRGNPRPRDPEKEDADNRWFVFLEGKVAIYVREEFLPSILEGPADDDRKTTGEFVANLAKVRRFAARQPEAGMQLVLKDIRRNLKRSTLPFQIPDEFEISASAAEDPKVVVRGEFVNVVEAKAFVQWWTETLREQIDKSFTLKLQVGWVHDLFEVEREGATVSLRAELTSGQAQKIMQFAADGSRKIAKKTPEQIEEMKRRRVEAMKARKGGKLPPSALDPVADEPDERGEPKPGEPTEPPPGSLPRPPAGSPSPPSSPPPSTPTRPVTPPGETTAPEKPTKTPAEAGGSGNVPG